MTVDQTLVEKIMSRHGLTHFTYASWYETFDKFTRYPKLWKEHRSSYIVSNYLPFWVDLSFNVPGAEHIRDMFLGTVGCTTTVDITLKQALALLQLLNLEDGSVS